MQKANENNAIFELRNSDAQKLVRGALSPAAPSRPSGLSSPFASRSPRTCVNTSQVGMPQQGPSPFSSRSPLAAPLRCSQPVGSISRSPSSPPVAPVSTGCSSSPVPSIPLPGDSEARCVGSTQRSLAPSSSSRPPSFPGGSDTRSAGFPSLAAAAAAADLPRLGGLGPLKPRALHLGETSPPPRRSAEAYAPELTRGMMAKASPLTGRCSGLKGGSLGSRGARAGRTATWV